MEGKQRDDTAIPLADEQQPDSSKLPKPPRETEENKREEIEDSGITKKPRNCTWPNLPPPGKPGEEVSVDQA
ncbi:hypothetical protein JTB14_021802 [Gonioctena quinquepunctata]|nr:hypothetical protein JTB14_021802 [Gonioctena quinquepunctata]